MRILLWRSGWTLRHEWGGVFFVGWRRRRRRCDATRREALNVHTVLGLLTIFKLRDTFIPILI